MVPSYGASRTTTEASRKKPSELIASLAEFTDTLTPMVKRGFVFELLIVLMTFSCNYFAFLRNTNTRLESYVSSSSSL